MKYIATFIRNNPQFKTGEYETTRVIVANSKKQAKREAEKIGNQCVYGSMILLNVLPYFPILSTCNQYKRICQSLTIPALREIERILTAFTENKIDFVEPTDENGNYIFCGEAEVIIRDKRYRETGRKLIVVQWLECHEDTDRLIEVYWNVGRRIQNEHHA